MHSLFGARYQDAIQRVYDRRDQRTYGLVRSAHALAAPYPHVLYSDLYDHRAVVRALANAGFSGLLWTPELRDAADPEDLTFPTTSAPGQSTINTRRRDAAGGAVVRGRAVTRGVPPRGEWFCFFTGARYVGGVWHQISADLDTLPLFVRSGTNLHLPLARPTAYAEAPDAWQFTVYAYGPDDPA